ncbi:MAG: TlpA family protein disulfide reductase [Bacteroidetes bacterium]|nr:TlpA family protein disulfide reductase [Bacteroidota bacterium]
MKLILSGLLFLLPLTSNSQNFRSLSSQALISESGKYNDTLYLLNFWATWCKPCIEELPWFESTAKKYTNKPVKMILVNLDFNSKVDSLVIPFIRRKKIESDVIHITDTDPNEWINKIDSSWSGAIPATVMIRNKNVIFFKEGTVSELELNSNLEKFNLPDNK